MCKRDTPSRCNIIIAACKTYVKTTHSIWFQTVLSLVLRWGIIFSINMYLILYFSKYVLLLDNHIGTVIPKRSGLKRIQAFILFHLFTSVQYSIRCVLLEHISIFCMHLCILSISSFVGHSTIDPQGRSSVRCSKHIWGLSATNVCHVDMSWIACHVYRYMIMI